MMINLTVYGQCTSEDTSMGFKFKKDKNDSIETQTIFANTSLIIYYFHRTQVNRIQYIRIPTLHLYSLHTHHIVFLFSIFYNSIFSTSCLFSNTHFIYLSIYIVMLSHKVSKAMK